MVEPGPEKQQTTQTDPCELYKNTMEQCIKYSSQELPCYEELRGYIQCMNNQQGSKKRNA